MKISELFIHAFLAVMCSADLGRMVRYFETLDSAHLHVVTRKTRSIDGSISRSKRISFKSFGRKFNLVLFPGSSVIGSNFRARTVDREGRSEPFFVDPNNFYSGHLEDDKSVEVDAHFEDGILSSYTYFPDETYVTEPAWRHRLNSSATMITYRHSDVNWEEILPIDPKTGNRTRMMDGIRLPNENPEQASANDSSWEPEMARHKRASSKDTCPLLVVADYVFFRDIGNSKRGSTAAFLISTMQFVNRNFRRTVWDSEKKIVNMGIHIDEMIVHSQFTTNPSGHYNADYNWAYNTKLNAFSHTRELIKFCLGHLMTSYAFEDNVLGLAYIASESRGNAGGICSISTRLGGSLGYPKTSWSSAKNSRGEQVLTLQLYLVVTHELGHSWGSEHDPLTDECGPGHRLGGKFVMWPYSVPGYDDNNMFFSPCSRRYISGVLRTKSWLCFHDGNAHHSLCGNGIIELDEECDSGMPEEGDAEDACCDNACQLKPGAKCSDFNHDCCSDCQVANSSVKCSDRNELTCQDQSSCDGKSLDCPLPGSLPDETECIDEGMCHNGLCIDFCSLLGRTEGKALSPCLCTRNETVMCRRCCAEEGDSVKGQCMPTSTVLQQGRTCFIGMCNAEGFCVVQERSFTQRFYNFLKHINVNNLVQGMRNNIVMTIMLLSLVVWIPACVIISIVDRRHRRIRDEHFSKFRNDDLAGEYRMPTLPGMRSKCVPRSPAHSQRHSAHTQETRSPAHPEATPHSPARPQATPHSPAHPQATPHSPAHPQATPHGPAQHQPTPDSLLLQQQSGSMATSFSSESDLAASQSASAQHLHNTGSSSFSFQESQETFDVLEDIEEDEHEEENPYN